MRTPDSFATPGPRSAFKDMSFSPFFSSHGIPPIGFTPRRMIDADTPMWGVDDASALHYSLDSHPTSAMKLAGPDAFAKNVHSKSLFPKVAFKEHLVESNDEDPFIYSPFENGIATSTPYGTTVPANANMVTGSGPSRGRAKPSADIFEGTSARCHLIFRSSIFYSTHTCKCVSHTTEKLLKKAILATPKSSLKTKQKADLSLHHIDSIKSPLDFGSPMLPSSP